MPKLTLLCLAIIGIMTVTTAVPHSHRDDPYSPVIEFLKQLRKARKHSGSIIGNREGEEGTAASSPGFDSQSQSQNQPSVGILFPSDSSNSQSSQSSGISSISSNNPNDQRINIQLPANFPSITPRPPSSPQDIQRINSGVSTILNGVRSFDLGQILRGAFIFPQNNNVKSVANNVLDSLFGPAGGQPPAQN